MHIFIDESGSFVIPAAPKPYVCCVAALVVPSERVDQIDAEFVAMRARWPAGQREVKGSRLDESQVAEVIGLANHHDLLLEISAADTGRYVADEVAAARTDQARKLTSSLTERHHPNFVREVHAIADRWEQLSNQLVTQLYLTVHVVWQVLNHAPSYFAQRIPSELSTFRWVLDRKDLRPTPYETLWAQLVCPFLQAMSLGGQPFTAIEGLDYSHMDRFRSSVEDFPHLKEEIAAANEALGVDGRPDALNVVKIVREGSTFEDSSAQPGLQMVDILASAFTRAMNGRLGSEGWGNLGRLFIRERDSPPVPFVQISLPGVPTRQISGRQGRVMEHLSRAAKSMLV